MPRISSAITKPASSKCAKPYDKAANTAVNAGGILLGMTPLQQYNNNILRNYAIKSYNHSKISPVVFSAICFSVHVFIFRITLPFRLSLIVLTYPYFVFKKDKKDFSRRRTEREV